MDTTNKTTRSDSTSTTASVASPVGSPTARRPSSGLFASLQQQKRSDNPEQMARRKSMHDQRPSTGFIGKLWNNYVYGTTD